MASADVYQVKIALKGLRPPIWRRVETKDCSLSKLHDIIQLAMGWDSYHLWAFLINRQQYGEDPESKKARKVRLSQVVNSGIKKFTYIYDFGDCWEHTIQVEKVVPAEPTRKYPRCVKASRACPPEDCGGVWGYLNLLEAVRDPKHPEHKELVEWVGGDFDPEVVDLEEINAELGLLR